MILLNHETSLLSEEEAGILIESCIKPGGVVFESDAIAVLKWAESVRLSATCLDMALAGKLQIQYQDGEPAFKTVEQFTNTFDLPADNQRSVNGGRTDTDTSAVNEQFVSDRALGSGITNVGNEGTDKHLKPHIRPGMYQHYKGKICVVFGLVRHSETLEWLVEYKEEDQDEPWVRPYEMFTEQVTVNGRSVPRFQSLSNVIASSEEWQP